MHELLFTKERHNVALASLGGFPLGNIHGRLLLGGSWFILGEGFPRRFLSSHQITLVILDRPFLHHLPLASATSTLYRHLFFQFRRFGRWWLLNGGWFPRGFLFLLLVGIGHLLIYAKCENVQSG